MKLQSDLNKTCHKNNINQMKVD